MKTHELLASIALLALACACGAPSKSPAASLPPADSVQTSRQALLSPQSDPHARIGLYNWQANYAGFGFSDDLNQPEENLIHSTLGARTVRVALSNPDAYTGQTYGSLSQVATSGPFWQLFHSCDFDTYILTTYSAADNQNLWIPDLMQTYYGTPVYAGSSPASAETTELTQLAQTLGSTSTSCPNPKRFIVINWEGDTAMNLLANSDRSPYTWNPNTNQLTQQAWDNYVAWISARASGIAAAGQANVFSGLEYAAVQRVAGSDVNYKNCAEPLYGYGYGCVPCDAAGNKCVSSYVAPRVSVDYLSYSSWQSLSPNIADSSVDAQLESDLSLVQSWTGKPNNAFIVGEFGADRNAFPNAATRISSTISGLTAWGAAYGIYWQVLDNASQAQAWAFGAYYPGSYSLTPSGQALQSYYASEPAPSISCVYDDEVGGCGTAHPGAYVSLYGSNFGSTSEVILGGYGLTISYISPDGTQLNAYVPTGVAGGAQTLEAYNGQWGYASVTVASSAPSISCVEDDTTGSCGSAHLGGNVTVWGSGFGATNYLYLGGTWLPVSGESTTQVTASVPTDVPTGWQTLELYDANTGQATYASVNVIGAPSVTCSLNAASQIAYDGYWQVSVTSSTAGYAFYWYGTHNGVQDAYDVYGGSTNFYASYGPYTNQGDWYTRYAVLRDGSGNQVCVTNTVTVSIE